ncbi:hypothetical protein BC939DRAFT_436946 [Gamsiella multidivaricata]|uniref:uncharacterized protein n=1 Tax=Gamsiella multidivaricata TaxID=101098 RepID=UPI0022209EDD|nr:uncharacterized protein BC939DRAFT_436946 [Gamsiella multidivaricata]KAI7831408.1 hypothetical protein BC939DRAFT_436946 [Gamsiella multidivaricata]
MLEYTMNLHAMAGSLSMPASAPVDVPPRLITRTADGRRIQARLREPLPNSDLVENGDDPEYVAMEDVSPAAAVQRDYVRREAIRNNLFAQQQRCEEIQAAKDAITGVGKSTCMFGPFKCVAEGCGNNCNPPRLPPGRLLQTFAVPAEDLIQAISVDRASESVIEAQQPSAASSINDARPMFSFSASNIRQLAVQSLSRATAARLRAATSPPMGPVATAMPLANPAAVRPYLTWTTAPHSNTQTPESETRIPATLSDLTQQEPDWASTTLVGTYSGSRVPYPRPPAPTSHLDSASKTGRSVSLSFGNPTSLRRRHARRHNIPPHLKQRLASRKSRLSVIQEMGEPASTPRRASFTLEAYETDGERQDLGNDNGIEESYDSDSEFEGIDLRGTLRRAESTIGSCFDGADSDRGSLHEESCNGALTPAGGALMVANPTLPDSNQPTVPNTSDLGFFRSCVPSSGLSITEEFGIRLQSPQARTPEFVLVPEERFASINPLIEASTNRFAERGAVEENGVLVFPESLTLLPHSRPQDVQSIQLENEMRLLREEFVRIRCEPPGVNATGSNTFQAQSQIRDTIEHQRVIEPLSFYGSRYGSSPSPSVTSLVDPVMLSASMTGASAPIAPRQHTPGFVSYRSCHLQALYQSYRHDAGAEEISRSTDGLPTYGELTSNASPAQMLIASPNVLAGDVPRSIQAQMEEEAARQQYFYRDFTTALYAMPPFDDEDGEFPESDYWIEGGSSEDEEDEEEVTGDDDVEGAFAYARLYQSGPVPDPQCIRDYQRHQRRIQRRLGLPVRPPSLTPEEMQDVTDFIRGYTE